MIPQEKKRGNEENRLTGDYGKPLVRSLCVMINENNCKLTKEYLDTNKGIQCDFNNYHKWNAALNKISTTT